MNTQKIKELLQKLGSVNDNSLRQGLEQIQLDISDNKYSNAFSAYGLSKFLWVVEPQTLRRELDRIPDPELEGIRRSGVFMLRAYTCLVYLLSEVFEHQLCSALHIPALKIFHDAFCTGCTSKGEDATIQHMRNALIHGTFELSKDLETVTFKDQAWQQSFSLDEVFSLCEQVFRFYRIAFDVSHNK